MDRFKTGYNIGDVNHMRISHVLSILDWNHKMKVFVISNSGERLMPTSKLGKVRHLLKAGKAKIVKHNPFTIQLLYNTPSYTQPIELCIDTGYQHIGVSMKSEKHEYVSEQYDLLPDEKLRHDDARKYRRTRRNRLRYRKPRFENRKKTKPNGWFAPSIKHKEELHVQIVEKYNSVAPLTVIYSEMGEFDTQVISAIAKGLPLPVGKDYQYGEQYGIESVRLAVFARDNYQCQCCKSKGDGVILHAHHWDIGGHHGNAVSDMVAICSKCHTAANHAPGGKLRKLQDDYKSKRKKFHMEGAAFMNSVRHHMVETFEKIVSCPIEVTYGAATKVSRKLLGIEKTHANDAYSMGTFFPNDREETVLWKKRRRNNRILSSFVDAVYIDIRDGSKKKGAQLGSERTNRREPYVSEKSLRKYRGEKVRKGLVRTRKFRSQIQLGYYVMYNGKKYMARGTFNGGKYVYLSGMPKYYKRDECKIIKYAGGWLLAKDDVKAQLSA